MVPDKNPKPSTSSLAKARERLIVALDVATLGEVRVLLEELESVVDYFKVGSQLFTSCGPAAVRFIEAKGKKVFLDLKYHDIPNTVASAVQAAVGLSVALERSMDNYQREKGHHRGLFMYTLHTCGGEKMLKEAVASAIKVAQEIGVAKPLAVGVTVLTSEEKKDNILPLVLERAALAKQCGLDGVVASCHEAAALRKEFGKDFLIVTPGIRPAGEDVQDQQRVATPEVAIDSGSSFLVVGRPIVKAKSPRTAAKNILEEIQSAL